MSVETTHPEYNQAVKKWKRCRDVVEGSDAVKGAGETYLPKLSGQEKAEYDAYKRRARFFNGTQRTVEALAGLIFRKEVTVELPGQMEPWMDAFTPEGYSLRELCEETINEVLAVGRFGILVDYLRVEEPETMTVARAESMGLRPYPSLYRAESITNWREGVVNGKRQLVLVTLKEETDQPDEDDEFGHEKQVRYRVLSLDATGYRVRVYRKDENGDYVIESDFYPVMNGQRMSVIPFFLIAPTPQGSASPAKPPLIDLVDTNLAHYQNSADYEHGLHFTGSPTPVVTGYSAADGEVISIGSETALVIEDSQAKAFYMEFSGAGLNSLKDAMADKKEDMATLGARLLTAEKRAVEAAETAEIHRSGESSVLAKLAGSVSKSLTRVVRMMAAWAGYDAGQAGIELNRDFLPTHIDGPLLKELVALWQARGMAHSDLFRKMKDSDLYAPDRDFDEMLEEIELETPGLTVSGDGDAE